MPLLTELPEPLLIKDNFFIIQLTCMKKKIHIEKTHMHKNIDSSSEKDWHA